MMAFLGAEVILLQVTLPLSSSPRRTMRVRARAHLIMHCREFHGTRLELRVRSDSFNSFTSTFKIRFTCNRCQHKTARAINPNAYATGTVFVQARSHLQPCKMRACVT